MKNISSLLVYFVLLLQKFYQIDYVLLIILIVISSLLNNQVLEEKFHLGYFWKTKAKIQKRNQNLKPVIFKDQIRDRNLNSIEVLAKNVSNGIFLSLYQDFQTLHLDAKMVMMRESSCQTQHGVNWCTVQSNIPRGTLLEFQEFWTIIRYSNACNICDLYKCRPLK